MSISDVFAEYERIRARNKKEENRRKQQVYRKVPALQTIHAQKNALQLERIKSALANAQIETDDVTALQTKANDMLVGAGFPADYLDPIFTCTVCHDTGTMNNSMRCACFLKRVLEDKLQTARLSDDNISFEKFDLDVFDDTPLENGKSQRDAMQKYKKIAEAYTDNFPDNLPIFLLSGGTGLGKTYISKCIMRRVIERGFTAAFYTAYRLFSMFHKDRIGENVDLSPIFEVPLLIIDDIGTEPMTRNVTIEYFFDLINERNDAGLHTIIVTNLTFDDIGVRYGERIYSRLMDERASKKILFFGKDVRYKVKIS